jgi:hypothetical protein
MTRTIDFYFDFPSPYSYLAHTQLPRIAAEHGAAVAYHPFRILELMKIVATGRPRSNARTRANMRARICNGGPGATRSILLETRTRRLLISPNWIEGHWSPSRIAEAQNT